MNAFRLRSLPSYYDGSLRTLCLSPTNPKSKRIPRTVVYERPKAGTSVGADAKRASDTNGDPLGLRSSEPDGYAEKIAKYVPAELVSVTCLFFAAFELSDARILLILAFGALINVAYLFAMSGQPAPRPEFYFLSALAFVFWAFAVVPQVRTYIGLEEPSKQAFVLAGTAFAIPLLDTLFSKVRGRKQSNGSSSGEKKTRPNGKRA